MIVYEAAKKPGEADKVITKPLLSEPRVVTIRSGWPRRHEQG
ncbi:hypothetical protein [Spirosoma fluminis]